LTQVSNVDGARGGAGRCPRCGRIVEDTALDGLCPACLMRQAFADDAPDSESVIFTSSVSSSTWTLVTLIDDDEQFVTYLTREHTAGPSPRPSPRRGRGEGEAQEHSTPVGSAPAGATSRVATAVAAARSGAGAQPPRLARLVVQKEPLAAADLDAAGARLVRRREALRAVRHPALAPVLDGGVTDDGHPFLVTAFVMARSLADAASQRGARHAAGEVVQAILDQALDALGALHAAGVAHGHVRESTVLAHSTTAGATAVVTGFAPLDRSSSLADDIQRDLEQFQQLASTLRV